MFAMPSPPILGALRLPLLFGCALVLAGCAGDPRIQTGDSADTILGSLNKVDNTPADLVYVDPSFDYARFTRVQLKPLDLDNVEIIQPPTSSSMVNRYNEEWMLNDADKQRLQAAFEEAMVRELSAGGAFTMTQESGDDVLVIEAMLTTIAPSGPKDDVASRGIGRSRVYSEGAGGMSIAIMFADGDSGEVLALVKDTRTSQNSNWGLNNSVTNMSEVRRNFSAWARQTHDGLLALRARGQ